MKKLFLNIFLTLSILLLPHEVFSESKKLSTLFKVGYTHGGEDLGWVKLQSIGGSTSTKTIRSGSGFLFSGGIDYRFTEALGLQATLGYHFDSVTATNGELSFDRVPLEALGAYRIGPHKLALGLTYHINPRFKFEFNQSSASQDYKNALGLTAEYMHFFNRFFIGVKYTNLSYETSVGSISVDGNHVGILMGTSF